jgi:hypothetical protein
MANITYYIGAGASFNAFPIQKHLCKCMIEMGEKIMNTGKSNSLSYVEGKANPLAANPGNEIHAIAFDLIYFGYRGLEFGTIDTYARKLSLIRDQQGLKSIKSAINMFFTIWQNLTESMLSQFEFYAKQRDSGELTSIDKRYYSLLSTIIEWKDDSKICLDDNINFISWNYDLQIELAFSRFSNTSLSCLNKNLGFLQSNKVEIKPKIIHLNGYSGYLNDDTVESILIELGSINSISRIHQLITQYFHSYKKYTNLMSPNINFAWEPIDDTKAFNKIDAAKEIIKNTTELIIVGYSFPAFNRTIDKEILNELDNKTHEIRIHYQDPNASKEKLIPILKPILVEKTNPLKNVDSGFLGPEQTQTRRVENF